MSVYKSITAIMFYLTLLPLAGQIQTTTGKGISTLNTTNLEPLVVQTIDGVSTHYYSNSPPGLSGSPYLDEQFQTGTMTIRDGTIIPGLRYRYDMFGDMMQMVVNGDTAVIDKPLAVRSVELGDKKFIYDVYQKEGDRIGTGYFEVVKETASMTILLRHRIELKQDVYVSNYGGGGGTKEFIMTKNDQFYVKLGEGASRMIKKKREFIHQLPVLKNQVTVYMKENRLSLKNKEDLMKIADFYNTMIFSDF